MNTLALLTSLLLLVINGFFVAAEFAYTASSRHQLAERATRSSRAAVAAIDELSFTLAGAQLGITIASLLLGFVAEPAVSEILEGLVGGFIEVPETALHTVSFIIALTIVVYLHMVIGEMVPKNIVITTPERSALALALPYRAYVTVFRPLIYLLNEAANLGLRVVGIDPTDTKEAHTADDLASMITAGRREGIVEDFSHRMLTGAIDLGDLDAFHVMVPRLHVIALPQTATPRDVEAQVVARGFTRFPLFGDDLDSVVGFVHAKDLLGLQPSTFDDPIPTHLIRDLLVVPETAALDRLLEDLRRTRQHMALVVDEYGGTAGIVTLEDIIEELVGEIRDEHDSETDGVRRISTSRYTMDGSLRPNEATRVTGIAIAEGEYETLGGLVMDRVGRIPRVGDRIDDVGWSMRVRRMDGRRVAEIDLVIKKGRSGDE